MEIVVCEVGIGNVRSVVRAVERALSIVAPTTTPSGGAGRVGRIRLARDPAAIAAADYVVVPGQGAFGSFAHAVRGGLGDALREHVQRGRPYLGICLGMQVLFDDSEEAPGEAGLGVFRGSVRRMSPGTDVTTGLPLALPHIGWNVVTPDVAGARFPRPAHFYFAHSYAVVPSDGGLVAATTDYGARFVSAIAKDNVLGVQFHPEKSQLAGLALLADFFRR